MKAEYINPFIQSVLETFQSMLDCEVSHGKPFPAKDDGHSKHLIAIIGLSGTAQGNIAVKFPPKTAMALVSDLVGDDFTEVDASVIDGVGELVNIIAGNAKAKFQGHKISISLPTVLRGGIHKLTAPTISYISIPFESNRGNFEILVSFRPTVEGKEEVAHESANCG
ncbi:MAG: chemotaxis protein CheX [candidate division Zixibacteria bacterium]|nr:chemotaxis protein CheX [candidate division Zixibacteria bacterium]